MFAGVTTIGLLAAIHPALMFLPLFGIPAVVIGGVAERRRRRVRGKRHRAACVRYYWLYATATEREHGKELRVFSTRDGMLRRHNELSAEVTGEIDKASETGTQVLTGLGWLVFALGFVLAVTFVVARVQQRQRNARRPRA